MGEIIPTAPTHSCAGGCGSSPAWGNLLRRDSPRPLSDLFAPPKHPFWRNFFGDGSPLPRLGSASGKWASSGPSPVVGRKPNNPLGAPGTGMASSEDGRSPYRWFAFRLAEGVSRGGNYLPRTCAPLRGWQRALARPEACRVGEVFFLAATPSCAGGSGPWPAHLVENFVETVERTKNARLFLNKPGIFLTLVTGWKEKRTKKGRKGTIGSGRWGQRWQIPVPPGRRSPGPGSRCWFGRRRGSGRWRRGGPW